MYHPIPSIGVQLRVSPPIRSAGSQPYLSPLSSPQGPSPMCHPIPCVGAQLVSQQVTRVLGRCCHSPPLHAHTTAPLPHPLPESPPDHKSPCVTGAAARIPELQDNTPPCRGIVLSRRGTPQVTWRSDTWCPEAGIYNYCPSLFNEL